MPLSPDPQMQAILERAQAAPAVDYRTLPIAEARRRFTEASLAWTADAPALPVVRDLTVPTRAGSMAGRLYKPEASDDRPVILFVHGGGWTFGSIETHDGTMRRLAQASGCAVLGIDYRLAPEHPFPEPLDDVLDAVRFLESGGLGDADGSRIALAGDSAGANLALAALLALRDAGAKPPHGAALFYGCYAPDFATGSHRRLGDGTYLLGTDMMQWYWRNFLGPDTEDTRSLAVPLRANLAGLPPLYLNAAGLDPLLDDTTALVARLSEAGVSFRYDHCPGVVHGFLRMARELDAAAHAIRNAAAFLAGRLTGAP